MSFEQVVNRVTKVVRTLAGDKLEGVVLTSDTQLFSGIGLTSVNAIELIVALEDEFGVFFDDDTLDMSRMQSVEEVATIIYSLLEDAE